MGTIGGYSNFYSPGFIKKKYLEILDISESEYNLLFTIPAFFIVLAILVMGSIYDRLGDRVGFLINGGLIILG